jgi:FkbM family methyltransferase
MVRYLDWQRHRFVGHFPFEQTISHSRIVAYDKRNGVSALIHSQGLYDYNNMRLLQELLCDGGNMFDVGANIGSYTLVASESPNASVYAFEPHPETCAQLRANVALNARPNVKVFQLALADRDQPLHLTNENGGPENRVIEAGADTVTVRGIRADTFCREFGAPTPGIVKIDVEGFEAAVIEGFGDLLTVVDALFVEDTGLASRHGVADRAVSEALSRHQLDGPYHLDFDSRRLRKRAPGIEDTVWLSPPMLARLRAVGFLIQDV